MSRSVLSLSVGLERKIKGDIQTGTMLGQKPLAALPLCNRTLVIMEKGAGGWHELKQPGEKG